MTIRPMVENGLFVLICTILTRVLYQSSAWNHN